MENPKNQIVDRIKEANNVLVTVSADPSVDQLAAAIGLTLIINKLGKHATAVFSGRPPSTIEFLKPEETLEKNTDSLRDFIIALDKSKADKLRYKVEDKMVKIFITPYRTSIDEKDLEFSQGDFNVDVVVGLGVKVREDLDQAIISHGRILHDATVVSINTTEAGSIGALNWVDETASSLSEMVTAMADMFKTGLLDEQIATALLTGVVAETDRFSNAKTTSNTMAASAKLMAAGANQQLIATKLEEPEKPQEPEEKPPSDSHDSDDDDSSDSDSAGADGSLLIDHDEELPEPQIETIDIDDQGNLQLPKQETPKIEPEDRRMLVEPPATDPDMPGYEESPSDGSRHLVTEPPALDGQLTANSQPEGLDPAVDPLSQGSAKPPLLSHDSGSVTDNIPVAAPPSTEQVTPSDTEQFNDETLTEIEESVDSPHLDQAAPAGELQTNQTDVDQARQAVQAATSDENQPLEPIAALNAQPVDLDLGHDLPPANPVPPPPAPQPTTPPAPTNLPNPSSNYPSPPAMPPAVPQPASPAPPTNGLPPNLVPPIPGLPADPTAPSVENPTAPPPVPPPMMPPMMPPATGQPPAGNPLMPPQQ